MVIDMREEDEGMYDKYHVEKKDGTTDPHADYFVLRIDSDIHARVAALAYAESIKEQNINLSFDIIARVRKYNERDNESKGN
jgi:hypothetical protein